MHHLTLNLFLSDVPSKLNALMHAPSVMLNIIVRQQLDFLVIEEGDMYNKKCTTTLTA
jgi:hypothetical protein